MYKQGFLITVHLANYPVVAEPADIHCSLNSTLPCINQWFFRQHHSELPVASSTMSTWDAKSNYPDYCVPFIICIEKSKSGRFVDVRNIKWWGSTAVWHLHCISHWPKESTFMKSEARKFTDSFKNKTEGTYQECRCFCW